MMVATDLDGTVISTGGDPDKDVCVEIFEGSPLSFVSVRGAKLLRGVADRAMVVPATTRLPHQYARLDMPWGSPEWVVVANGGIVMRGGVNDQRWSDHVNAVLLETGTAYDQFLSIILDFFSGVETFCPVLREAHGLFFYFVGSPEKAHKIVWETARKFAVDNGWLLSVQGRKAYFVPKLLDKSLAVSYVAEQSGEKLELAAGDSLLDLSLLELAPRSLLAGGQSVEDEGVKNFESVQGHGIERATDVAVWLHENVFRDKR
jgi:hydroxymethylpyrimidine pyrophosphatase-like HAD family hydrolase